MVKTFGLAIGLMTAVALKPAVGANLVANGDFEGGFHPETHIPVGYNIANNWFWCPYPIVGTTSDARAFAGVGLGMDGSSCQRLRVIQNRTAQSFMWQVVNTVPGTTYEFKAYWKIAPAGGGSVGNPLFPWIGAYFIDGGSTGDSQAAYQANHDLIRTFLPTVGHNNPYRMQWPYDPPFVPTTLIIPNNKQIVAERAYFYFYYQPQLADATQLNDWESIYDAAGGANTPTPPVINVNTATIGIGMPGIGETAENGGGAAWQTKVAAGNTMLVGFFVLDCPSTTGDGTDLYIDNVSVTEVCSIPTDLDGDGDVDEVDFNQFVSCASGAAVPHNGTALCQQADFDDDDDVDPDDFGELQRCYSGSGNPTDSACCQ